ncbi:MAG TPA: hypothetical protein VF604_08105 [Pyrinomonadaceae bacterium]|jgi:hypothetical protein
MKIVIVLGLFFTLGFFYEANAQSESTKIVRFEIDGKEVRKNHKIFFRLNDKLVESKKTSTGFIIPAELRNKEYLAVLITLGKYKLEFSEIRISKFEEDWIVGIDKKPFSEEIAYLIDKKTVKRVYYIHFAGSAIETGVVVQEK